MLGLCLERQREDNGWLEGFCGHRRAGNKLRVSLCKITSG